MDVQIDITGKRFETERLILRPWLISDLNDFYEYASVEGVGEAAGWKHHESIEESKKILQAFIEEKNVFAIVLKDENKVIGSLGLHCSWANDDSEFKGYRQKEIGYVLSKSYWGKGLMTEAVKAVIPFCFAEWDIEALAIGHFEGNRKSRRVIEKCGFRFIKQSDYYAKQLQKSFVDMKYILIRASGVK